MVFLFYKIAKELGASPIAIVIALGIIGTYMGKIYSETKARPRYIVESFINEE